MSESSYSEEAPRAMTTSCSKGTFGTSTTTFDSIGPCSKDQEQVQSEVQFAIGDQTKSLKIKKKNHSKIKCEELHELNQNRK